MADERGVVASTIAASVRLTGEAAYSVDGAATRSQPDLRELIYRVFHCRQRNWAGRDRSPFAVDRSFERTLSAANCGSGSSDAGWTVLRIEPSGDIVVEKDGIRLWVARHQLRIAACRAGEVGAISVGKEMRRTSFGFYLALGDRNLQTEDDIVRIYWTVTAAGAASLLRRITQQLNSAAIAFRFKLLNLPGAFDRTDAAVLYLNGGDLAAWAPALPAIHFDVRRFLRSDTSLFARRLAPGVALAEDCGGPTSFGRGMARLCAEGLVAAFVNGRHSTSGRTQEIVTRLRAHDVDPERPYLRPGSRGEYSALDGLFD